MNAYVLGFREIDKTSATVVGGKGANLAEISRLEGICVPDGFCVSVEAFKRVFGASSAVVGLLDRLSRLTMTDRNELRELCGEIRRVIEGIAIPGEIEAAITRHLARLGAENAYAVRSSATAEDSPTASFAGQQDTYLNVIGKEAVLAHISKCWASLFTERAVVYRLQNGFDHRDVHLAVVVQRMISAQAAGVLFTADPLTSDRKVASIDAGFGLGEDMVAGLVNVDAYKVRDGEVIAKKVATDTPALTDGQIRRLEHIGRKLEAHFGCPQDIEWCLADDTLHLVQSRPITTLFPIPEASDGQRIRVDGTEGYVEILA